MNLELAYSILLEISLFCTIIFVFLTLKTIINKIVKTVIDNKKHKFFDFNASELKLNYNHQSYISVKIKYIVKSKIKILDKSILKFNTMILFLDSNFTNQTKDEFCNSTEVSILPFYCREHQNKIQLFMSKKEIHKCYLYLVYKDNNEVEYTKRIGINIFNKVNK